MTKIGRQPARLVARLSAMAFGAGLALLAVASPAAAQTACNSASAIVGTPGNDTLRGTAGADIICGLGGNDVIFAGAGHDLIYGGGGHDTIYATDGNDTVYGQSGNDYIDGNNGNDRIFPGPGNDEVYGGLGNDYLSGGDGATDGDDELYGQHGDDRIFGKAGDDWLDGGPGNDELFGAGGNDKLFGGTGDDWLAGSYGNDNLFGNAGDDFMDGQWGHDYMSGAEGADRMYGRGGDDVLYGYHGNDVLAGGAGRDLLVGGSGADGLHGSAGNDTLHGGPGNDTLHGHSGTDTYYGSTGIDSCGATGEQFNGCDDRDICNNLDDRRYLILKRPAANTSSPRAAYETVVFDTTHMRSNWELAGDVFGAFASGASTMHYPNSGFNLRLIRVDTGLTGDARIAEAWRFMEMYMRDYEHWQGTATSRGLIFDDGSSFSFEDLPSNYLGFISYVTARQSADVTVRTRVVTDNGNLFTLPMGMTATRNAELCRAVTDYKLQHGFTAHEWQGDPDAHSLLQAATTSLGAFDTGTNHSINQDVGQVVRRTARPDRVETVGTIHWGGRYAEP